MRIQLLIFISFCVGIFQYMDKQWQSNDSFVKTVSISIVDSSFYLVLDNMLNLDCEKEYFSDNISYGIIFNCENPDTTIIKIEGNSNNRIFINSKDLMGGFEYKGHDYFVLGKCIPKMILKKSSQEMFFKRSNKAYYPTDDDRWGIYYYIYHYGTYYGGNAGR